MEGIENDIILQLIGAFVEFSNEAVVPLIVEQVCDEPFCCDDNNYNLASQALPCNIHFVCENYSTKNMIFITVLYVQTRTHNLFNFSID